MAIEIALAKFLKSDAQVANLTGGRVWPMRAPQAKNVGQATYPRLTYARIGTTRIRSNDGPTYLCTARIQLNCLGRDPEGYAAAKTLADAVRLAKGGGFGKPLAAQYATLDGFRGTMAGTFVQGAFLDDDVDDIEPPTHSDDVAVYRVSMDLTISFAESLT